MNRIFYFSLFISSLMIAGCANKEDDPQVPSPDPTPIQQPSKRISIDATITKVGPISRARFAISRRPKLGRFLSLQDQPFVFELGLNKDINASPASYHQLASLEQADLKNDSLYLSLYYVDTNTSGFIKPTLGDEVTVQVKINGRSSITMRVNTATYQDSTNKWRNHNGYLNSGIEKGISL